jgi:cytidine deaminase
MIEEVQAQRLRRAALAAMERAHAPYSGFTVGAALLDEEGRIHPGCNVENASLGLSICAERAAACRAVADGARRFVAVAIATPGEGLTPPCGACRQFLLELGRGMDVFLVNDAGGMAHHLLDDLMPAAFLDFRRGEGRP